MIFKLEDGSQIDSTKFSSYAISAMSEDDLSEISRYCFHILRTQTQEHMQATGKAMLDAISSDKNFRASKNANLLAKSARDLIESNSRSSTFWAKRAFFGVVLIGVIQAVATIVGSIISRH